MADVKLSRPAQGQHIVVPSTPDARMILDFSADQVNIDRPEGSNSLFFQFGDGASIELQNFYTAYNKEEMPEFQIDGQIIAGTDFFQAFGPDLLPAAGPAASAERGARYSEYANMSLAEGTWHLNELDYRLAFDGQQSTDEWQNGVIDNLAPTLSTAGAPITLGLIETGWDGTNAASPAPSVTGSFSVRDPDGDNLTATVTIGGKTVAVNLTGPTTVESDYGSLVITPRGGGSNITFDFEYTLKEEPYSKTDQLAQGEQVTDGIVISVNDGMGHTVTQPINVVITGSNDAPDIEGVTDLTLKDDGHFYGVYGEKSTDMVINANETNDTSPGGLTGAEHLLRDTGVIVARDPDHGATLQYGIQASGSLTDTKGVESTTTYTVESFTPPADGPSPTTVSGCDTSITTDYGTFYLNSHTGEYEFVVNKDSTATNKLAEGQSITLAFHPTVTDGQAADLQFDVTRGHGTPTGGADGISITIMGSNDLPTASHSWNANAKGVVVDYVTEDSKSHNKISGTIVGKDVDANETETLRYGLFHPDGSGDGSGTMEKILYVVPNGTDDGGNLLYSLLVTPPPDRNYYGELTITGAGASATYTFELNNTAKCVQALDNDSDVGSSLTVKFPIVIKDDFGGFVKEDIALKINGVNDAPKFISKDDEGNAYKYSITVRDEGVYAKGDAASEGEQLNPKENLNTRDDGLGAGRHRISASGKIAVTDVDNGDNEHLAWGVVTTNEGNIQVSSESSILGKGDSNSSKTFYVLGDHTVVTTLPQDSDGKDTNNYYGKFIIHDDGSYTFTANTAKDSPVDKLNEYNAKDPASFAKITVPLYANDNGTKDNGDEENHNDVVKNITIFIRGSNEAPKLTGGTDLTIKEHASSSTNMTPDGATIPYSSIFDTVSSTDADSDANPKYSLVLNIYDDTTGVLTGSKVATTLYVMKGTDGNPILTSEPDISGTHENYFGKLVMGSDGTYTFTLYDDATVVQQMDTNDWKEQKFTVAVQDSHGAYDYKELSLIIKGANDAPTFSGTYSGTVKESGVYADNTPGKLNSDENILNSAVAKPAAEGTLVATDVDDTALTYGIQIGTGTGAQQLFAFKGKPAVVNVFVAKGHVLSEGYTLSTAGTVEGSEKCGTLTLKADGSWKFDLIDTVDAVNGLREGVNPEIKFTPIVTDSSTFSDDGKPTELEHKVTILTDGLKVTVQGSNEAPTLILDGTTISVIDGGTTSGGTTSGSVRFTSTDPDVDDSPNYRLVLGGDAANDLHGGTLHTTLYVVKGTDGTLKLSEAAAGEDTYGTLTVSDGTYKFTLANGTRAVQEMSGVDHKSITFNVAVVDGAGAYDYKPVTLDITGKNDAVQVTSTDAQVIQAWEEGVARTDGDPNADFSKGTEYNGESSPAGGTFTVTQVDGGKENLQYGFKVTTVTTVDGKEVSVVTYHAGSYANEYGTFTIDTNGKYTFALNNDATATQNLAAGQTVKLGNVELAAWDTRHGATAEGKFTPAADLPPATQQLNIYIKGTNDKPDFTIGTVDAAGARTIVFDSGLTEENKKYDVSVNGALKGADPDSTDPIGSLTYSIVDGTGTTQVLEGNYGVLELDPDGSYTYTLTKPEKLQSLNDGQKLIKSTLDQEVFSVRIQDAHGAYSNANLQIDIDGVKDTPRISASNNSIFEDSGAIVHPESVYHDNDPTTTGKFTLSNVVDKSDVDSFGADGKASWKAASIAPGNIPDVVKAHADMTKGDTIAQGDYGYLVVKTNGTYEYFLTENDTDVIQKLNVGDRLTESFKVTATAGSSSITQEISISIHGTNDKPYFTTDNSVFEGAAKPGNFEDANHWGDTENPGTVFVGKVTGGDIDDAAATLIYKFAVTDDKGNITSYATEVKTDYGTISMDPASGEYTYYLDTYSKKLAKGLDDAGGESIKDSVKVVVIDPHGAASDPKVLTITIAPGSGGSGGADCRDPSILLSEWFNTVKEDGGKDLQVGNEAKPSPDGVTVTGQLDAIKWDGIIPKEAADHGFGINDGKGNQVQGMQGKYGYLAVNPATGQYSYTLYNSRPEVQALNEGETVWEKFPMMFNGKPWTELCGVIPVNVIIKVTGTNDAPEVTSYKDITLTEGGGFAFTDDGSYKVVATDVDEGETASLRYSLKGSATGDYGTFKLNPDGTYSYAPKDGLNFIEGTIKTDTFTVVVTDMHGATTEQEINVNLKGANDAPTIKIDSNAEGVTVKDGVPVITATEDTTIKVNGNAKAFFVDDEGDDNLTFAAVAKDGTGAGGMVVRGEYGVLTIKPDGSYSYTLNNTDSKVQGLNASSEVTETFTIIATDKYGASARTDLKVDVKGTNDAPEVSVGKVLTITESTVDGENTTKGTVYGTANVYDVDDDQHTFFFKTGTDSEGKPIGSCSITNQYGEFKVDDNGNYSFVIDNSLRDVKALKAGELVETKATLVVNDGNGGTTEQDIVVNIKGTNTAPVISEFKDGDRILMDVTPVSGSLYEVPTLGGSIAATDYDGAGDAMSYFIKSGGSNVTEISNTYGTLKISAEGKYTFTLNGKGAELLKSLGEGQTLADLVTAGKLNDTEAASFTFTLVAQDKYGAKGSQELKIDLKGVNDAPVAHDGHYTTLTDTLSAKDVDLNDSLIFSLSSDATYGHVTVHSSGAYHYDFHTEQGLANLEQHLSDKGWNVSGDLNDSFIFTVTDNHGASHSATASLTLTADIKDLGSGRHGVDISGGSETSHLLFGSDNGDTLDAHGETGSHILYGGGGDDTLSGGDGDDYLFGGADNDHLYGGAGNDHLYGGAGNDHLYGGAGNDFLDGGTGTNHLYGGEGNDVLVFHSGDTIDGGAGLNVLINHSAVSLDSLLADPNQVKNVSVCIQDGANDGDGTASLTDMNALDKAGIKMGDNSISLDSSQWAKEDDHTFINTTHDLTITTTTNVMVTDSTTEKHEFILNNL